MQMFSEHVDEVLDGFQAAFECGCAPLCRISQSLSLKGGYFFRLD